MTLTTLINVVVGIPLALLAIGAMLSSIYAITIIWPVELARWIQRRADRR